MSPGYWSETAPERPTAAEPEVTDMVFRIQGRQIPTDHAFALSHGLQGALPWLATEPRARVHLIHGPQSSNGWQRPDDDGLLELSARTRLTLRVPTTRVHDAQALSGRSLDLYGHTIHIGDAHPRPLSRLSTEFAHYVNTPTLAESESDFLETAAEWLNALSIKPKKMLCGRTRYLKTPDTRLVTRSLLLADLTPDESLVLQTEGLGPHRLLGCGVFVPSKSIAAVYDPKDEH
ncbi:MAG: type I-MYXAN CRISPR-associated protein Cas6/Cmx6 [Arenicellales bacterium]